MTLHRWQGRRRWLIEGMWAEGMRQVDIARAVGIGSQAVRQNIEYARRRWPDEEVGVGVSRCPAGAARHKSYPGRVAQRETGG